MKHLLCLLLLLSSIGYTAQTKKDSLLLLAPEEDHSQAEALAKFKMRRQMLNWHTYTAWASVGLMAATFVSAPDGNFDNTHKWLGIASGIMYLGSASLAYLAPRPAEVKQDQNIMIHKHLTWIHAPAMLLAIYSGMVAHKERKDGKQLSTLADLHSVFAGITAVSFGLAAVSSMDWTLNFIPAGNKDIACIFTKRF